MLVALTGAPARAETWTLWADGSNGLVPGTNPSLAISAEREIFYTYLGPQMDGVGEVWRASLDDPTPMFTPLPGLQLPTPPPNMSYANVGALAVNARGEPVVGLATNGNWQNTAPMLHVWDKDAAAWVAAVVSPKENECDHNMRNVALAPNGDLWATCQWNGAYHSTDDGRTYAYVDVSALVVAQVPSYVPTRASGAGDLGALYSLVIGGDGHIYIGSETGGVVYSTDDGATFRPLDWAPDDPMSSMARATNLGNIAGLGLTPDGRVMAQGAPGVAPYPPDDTVGFYVFDLVNHTTTLGGGFPDYLLSGLTVAQIVTTPSGKMYLHTGHDSVDGMTGAPAFGGIMSSMDGVQWAQDNDGIDEVFMIPNMNVWIDGNGRADVHPFAVDGSDIYTATTSGKIYKQSSGAPADTTSGGDTGETSGGSAGETGAPTSSDGATSDMATSGATGGATGEASSSGPATGELADGDAEGCGCRSDDAPAAALLVVATVMIRRRRR